MWKIIYSIAVLALVLFFVTACNQSNSTTPKNYANLASDGYQFGHKEYTKTQLEITVIEHPSSAELSTHVKTADGSIVWAYSIIHPSTNKCEVHIVDPLRGYYPEQIGHEFAHCIYGRWHDQPVVTSTK
jgi:hypothetical protein